MLRMILLLSAAFIFGCAHRSVVQYDPHLEAKPEGAIVDVYSAGQPAKPYREIGRIVMKSKHHPMDRIMAEARKIGADGVIMVKSDRRGGIAVPFVYSDPTATASQAAPVLDTAAASAGSFR